MVKADSTGKKSLIDSTFPRYSGMITAATLASTISSFVDGCITGKMLGSEAMGAFGIAMPFVLILAVVSGMILSSGGSICSSKAIGAGNREKANSNFTACLIMGVIIGALAVIVFFLLPDLLISLTGTDGTLAQEAAAYLRGYGFGAIPTILLTILMNYADLDGNENLAFIAVIVMTVVDILLDFVLGVNAGLGLFGMALATSISYICSIAVFLVGFLKGHSSFRLRFTNLKTEMADILKTGYPAALNTLLVSMRCFFLNTILMNLAGSDAVSALSFQSNFNQIFIAIATGISTAVSVLVGIFIGEKDHKEVCSSVKSGLRYGILLSAILMVIFLIAAPLITGLLLEGTEQAISYAVMALRLYSLSMPVSIICITLISYYQTTGDRKTANTIAIGHGLILPLGCAWAFSGLFGLNGVWISTFTAEILMLIVLALILKKRTGKLPGNLEQFAFIDSKAFPDEKDVFAFSSETKKLDTAASSSHLQAFLSGKGCDPAVVDSVISLYGQILTDVKAHAQYADVQSCVFNSTFSVNIRCDGRDVDKLVNSPEWQKTNTEVHSALKAESHYSAGISFIGIHA